MKIAILDDDIDQLLFLCQSLTAAGYSCQPFARGEDLDKNLATNNFDLLILDWNLPGLSGEDLLISIRQRHVKKNVPIMFVTGFDDDISVEKILNSGADDYLIKPVSRNILEARVAALLRRSYLTKTKDGVFSVGGYLFDTEARHVSIDGGVVRLTPREYNLVILLFKNIGKPLSRDKIRDLIWNQDSGINSRTIDTHMTMIRSKLKLRPDSGFRLSAIKSYGYRLELVNLDCTKAEND